MTKTLKPRRRSAGSYTITTTNEIIRPGDNVLLKAAEAKRPPYVARVDRLEYDDDDESNTMMVRVQWYYRPEESQRGRRPYNGVKELFLSDHFDWESAFTIEGKCVVHSFDDYKELEYYGPEDYFCRFQYEARTGVLTPQYIRVYCVCELPCNPDDFMVQCEGCDDWYHPACIGMTIEDVKQLDQFFCADCTSDD